jgi:hypothetical protein
MKRHVLKTWPKGFEALVRGQKSYELRKDDRGFEVGDILNLSEWKPRAKRYTGRWIRAEVTYITHYGDFPGLVEGYVILGLGYLSLHR